MIKKKKIWIYPLILMGFLFILINSCKKPEVTIPSTPTIGLPVLSTTAVTNITLTTATSGGNITSDGSSAVTARGVCWSTGQSFTLANCLNYTTDGADVGSFTSAITGLNPNTTYYVRAYATNGTGTGYGNLISFTTSPSTMGIGYSYQGGIIAYILQPGDPGYDASVAHGLIAAPSDQSTGIQWYHGIHITTGATGTALGTGLANTNAIIASQGTGSYAAMLCHNLYLGGYSDWYLPSKDELNKLYLNQTAIGGFNYNANYWSSSENYNLNAWFQNFLSGIQDANYKGYIAYVRAVRAF